MNTPDDIAAIPVSVIIPCFNHGHYLAEAIESVLNQQHPNVEVIVVDDGSTDDTSLVAGSYPGVRYIRQANQGLSAARNRGIAQASGQYLVFLDSDDLLLPKGITANLRCLVKNRWAGFVSGAHRKVTASGQVIEETTDPPDALPYLTLLQRNYIGMHGAVMYPRWIFDSFRYDTSLKACEDYDLYLKIAEKHPVLYHRECIACYRIHPAGMSANIPLMLDSVLTVLARQPVSSREEIQSLRKGRSNWIDYYCGKLYCQLGAVSFNGSPRGVPELALLRKYRKDLYLKFLKRRWTMNIKTFVKRNVPASLPKLFRKPTPTGRLRPVSTQFGYDRGGPLDRYYIENFLQLQALHIQGVVLEIGDNEYTLRFGGQRVSKSEVLHVDGNHPKATWTGDLSNAPHLPDNRFDCIILTQTLHLIYHYQDALTTCCRILRPGGKLLLTVPGITPIDHGEWESSWYWSFTEWSVTRMLSEVFPPEKVVVETYGNVLIASAFLYGLGLPEFNQQQLDYRDPHFPVTIAAVAEKPHVS